MKKYLTFFILLVMLVSSVHGQSNEKTYHSIAEALKDSSKVKKLSLDGGDIKELPIEILKFKNLEEIDLESNPNLNIGQTINLLAQLTHLTKLWISDVKGLDMKGISQLKYLKELDLDNAELTDLPIEISELKNLREINLEKNPNLNMAQALSILSKVGSLKVLWLSENKLSQLPEEISELKNLEDLWLDGNDFTEIPKAVRKMKLKYLSLFDNKIKEIHLTLGDLSNLENINLCYNAFQSFPVILSLIPNLHTIKMWYNPIKDIPKSIANLKYLNLENNELTNIPYEMTELKHLKELSLSGNKLTASGIQPVYSIKGLTKLELKGNNIAYLDVRITNLNKLEDIDISNNPITRLPIEFSNLKNLRQLGIGELLKMNWSDTFSILEGLLKLRRIGMYYEHIMEMPDGFEKLKQVDTFWLNGNSFNDQEQERIKKLLPNAKMEFN